MKMIMNNNREKMIVKWKKNIQLKINQIKKILIMQRQKLKNNKSVHKK